MTVRVERILSVRLRCPFGRKFTLTEAAARSLALAIQNSGVRATIQAVDSSGGAIDLAIHRRGTSVSMAPSGIDTTWETDAKELFEALKAALGGQL